MELDIKNNRINQILKDANLSEDELKYLNQIIDEMTNTGASKTLQQILDDVYIEVPVSFYQFITDDNYMGKALKDSVTGKLTLYDYWVNAGINIFDKGKKYLEILLTGSTRIGKSFFAALCMSYKWYRVMCLKDPHSFYKLSTGTPLVCGFYNLTLDLSYSGMYFLFNNFLSISPWFQKYGYIAGSKHPTYTPYNPAFQVVVASSQQDDGFIGKNLYIVGEDEINFEKNKGIDSLQVSKLMDLYINVQDRASGTFGTDYLLCLVSSKNTENGFLEQYIEKEKNKSDKYVVDEPQWVILKDKYNYTEKKFYVAIGDRYTKSRILDDNENVDEVKLHQQVIEVPCGFDDKPNFLREAFELDLERSIRNRAGIANVKDGKFFNMDRVLACYKDYLINPFSKTVIEIGFDDDSKIQDYVLINKLPKLHRELPHFIHWDASYSDKGDATGLSMLVPTNIKKVKKLVDEDIKELEDVIIKLVFAIAIKPKPGDQINFQKIRQFIYWLITDQHFNIVNVSMDSFQSADALQIMSQKGIKTELLSVDRTLDPYMSARNTINEGRLIMPKISYLENEFADVMLVNGGKKVDHTKEGCFTIDTQIKLIGGTSKSIENLLDDYNNGIENYVYTINENTFQIEYKRIKKVFYTKTVDKIMKIVLTNNKEIYCTPEHRFMLLNGRYEEIQNIDFLTPIMSVFGKLNIKRKEIVNSYIDVYDLEIEDNHNFALDADVFVHNSKDLCDSVVANIFKINRSFQNQEIEVNASYMLNMNKDNSQKTIEDAIRDNTFILGTGSSVIKQDNNNQRKLF